MPAACGRGTGGLPIRSLICGRFSKVHWGGLVSGWVGQGWPTAVLTAKPPSLNSNRRR